MEVMLEDFMSISLENEPVLSYIESTLHEVISQIQIRPLGKPQIVLHRVLSLDHSYDPVSGNILWHIKSCRVTYGWPGNTELEAWRFACLSRILVEIYSAIKAGMTVTKRDIYYRDPTLFKRQEVVNKYIDDIAFTCQVKRKDLNVHTASPKGLGIGWVQDSDDVQVLSDGTEKITGHDLSHVKWILVVEKEAIFKVLVERKFHVISKLGTGVIITGKGYPDLLTRRFLRGLIDATQRKIPTFGLFDADPDGLEILKCYSLGSKSLAQELDCSVPEMVWTGVSLNDVLDLVEDDCIALTSRDRAKAQAMLTRLAQRDVRVGQRFEDELQKMLMLNMKAETEALDRRHDLADRLEGLMDLSTATA